MSAANNTVFESSFEVEPTQKGQALSSERFDIPQPSNIQVSSHARLNNNWLELDLALVNAQDETIKETKQALEFYSGSDYDGYWTEGDLDKESLFSAVPKGEYRLLVDADSDVFQLQKPVSFNIQVKRDVAIWSNFWITVLLLVIYPCYVSFRHRLFESARWAESDFLNVNLE
jgi:hypothetical protein